MQKEQLQQNVKDKVRVFEDGGIRLLKKGQSGLVHAIFSRFGLVLVLLLLQVGALFSLVRWFNGLLPHYVGGSILSTAIMMVYLLNQDMDNSVRVTWLVVIALVPVLGVPLFWYTKADVGHNALKKRLMELEGQTACPAAAERYCGPGTGSGLPGGGLAGTVPAGARRRIPGV